MANPLIALIVGCIVCCILTSASNFCPSTIKKYCFSLAGVINCVICIYVLYLLATSS